MINIYPSFVYYLILLTNAIFLNVDLSIYSCSCDFFSYEFGGFLTGYFYIFFPYLIKFLKFLY